MVDAIIAVHPAVFGFIVIWIGWAGAFAGLVIGHRGPFLAMVLIGLMCAACVGMVPLGVAIDGGPGPLVDWLDTALNSPAVLSEGGPGEQGWEQPGRSLGDTQVRRRPEDRAD